MGREFIENAAWCGRAKGGRTQNCPRPPLPYKKRAAERLIENPAKTIPRPHKGDWKSRPWRFRLAK